MRSIVTCMTSDHNKSIINNRSLNAFCCSSFHDLATIHPFVHSVFAVWSRHTRSSFLSFTKVSLVSHGRFRTHWISRWAKKKNAFPPIYSCEINEAQFVILWKLGRHLASITVSDSKRDGLPNFDKKRKIKNKKLKKKTIYTTAVQRRARSEDPVQHLLLHYYLNFDLDSPR